MTKPNAKIATFSVSCTPETLEHIDRQAKRLSQTRSAYVLSWLPDAHNTGETHRETPRRERGQSDRA